MKTWLVIGLLVLADHGLSAPPASPVANVLRSVSGQFVIHDRRAPASALNPGGNARTKPDELELAPSFLVVSCERIKQALTVELAAGRDWSGTINVTIRPNRRSENVPRISVERFGPRWNYKVEFPQRLERVQFVRTLVQVLLLELANRTPSNRSAEIPLWLTEGLTQQLLAAHEAELVLSNPSLTIGTMTVEPTMILSRDPDPLARARQVLRTRAAPTLEELSWPEPNKFSSADAEFFQASAQVFISELLRLKNGADRLRAFVGNLPRYYNWQTAFQKAYEAEFPNLLTLEKWWALQAAHFTGRDHKQLWTPEESAQKLTELLHVSVAVRTEAADLPARMDVSLQTVLREWDTVRQLQTVREKLKELEQALARVTPAYMELVNDYHVVLTAFVTQRSRSTSIFGWLAVPHAAKQAADEAIFQLNGLDVRRQQLALTNAVTTLPSLRELFPSRE
jgi:hypothetical protein